MMEKRNSKLTGLMVLLVFCVLAVSILVVLLTGAGVYQRLVEREQEQFDRRTAARYLTTRLRQSDVADSLRVTEFDGQSALVFREEIEGSLYDTLIYCYDGYVRELFISADASHSPCAFYSPGAAHSPWEGEQILEAAGLRFDMEENLLRIEITLTDGQRQELLVQLRSEVEVAE